MSEITAASVEAGSDVNVDVALEPFSRPSADALACCELPHRSFPEGNGLYAHFLLHLNGAPAYKRITRGDHDDCWRRALAG